MRLAMTKDGGKEAGIVEGKQGQRSYFAKKLK